MVYFNRGAPYLSVIIPTKNEEKRLPVVVESLRAQNFRDFEIIVADAYSSDKTRGIADKLGCIVTNGGRPDVGRNTGAAVANKSSRYLAFLDADASLDNNDFLEKALMEMEGRWLGVAGTLQKPMYEGNWFRHLAHKLIYEVANIVMLKRQHTQKPLMQNLMFARKDVHNAVCAKVGGFRPLEFGEDSKYAQDAVACGHRFGILETPGMVYISPRRFVKEGLLSVFTKNLKLIRMREKGEEILQSEREQKGKYWTD